MMKIFKIILITLFAQIGILAHGQEVIASGGNFHNANDVSINWTLGEFVIHTIESGDYILTQGFNQSQLNTTAIFESRGLDISIDAYPNPTSNYVTVDLDTKQPSRFHYQIVNQKGAVLTHNKFNQESARVSFLNKTEGIYLLRILKDNILVKTFKIYKK